MEGIRDGNPRQAIEAYAGEEYVQHSTGVPTGKEGFVEFFDEFLARNPDRRIEIVRAFEDGRYVFLHVTQLLNGGADRWVTADIFDTDDDGRMIEHWDIIEEFAAAGMVDGPTEAIDLDRTEQNRQLVVSFVEQVLRDGRSDLVADFLEWDVLVSHHPRTRGGLREGLDGGRARRVYGQIHRVVACGDMVAVLSAMRLAGEPMAVIDLFRVADGRIVEHWDVMEPIPTPDVAKNSGKF
jgi:predicted SnoaL-like aldol condensation-catalyzing enzyme